MEVPHVHVVEVLCGSLLRIQDTPRTINNLTGMLTTLERFFHVSRWMTLTDEHGVVVGV